MSVRVMSAVWDLELPDSEKLVALALADWSDDFGKSWPSVGQIAKKCCKSERTIQGALASLEKRGVLERNQRPGKGCIYTLNPRKVCTPAKSAPPQPLRETPAESAPNTSGHVISQKATPSSKKARAPKSSFLLPDDIPAKEWAEYEEMRRVIRKPMTDGIRQKAIDRLRVLAADGWPPGVVLSHSILNSYQGLFPPKDDRNGTSRNHTMGGHRGGSQSGLGRTVDAAQRFVARGGPA